VALPDKSAKRIRIPLPRAKEVSHDFLIVLNVESIHSPGVDVELGEIMLFPLLTAGTTAAEQ
jgi:hypothetical protein